MTKKPNLPLPCIYAVCCFRNAKTSISLFPIEDHFLLLAVQRKDKLSCQPQLVKCCVLREWYLRGTSFFLETIL